MNTMVRVTVTEGVLEGEVVQSEYGGKFCSFKGIPYAEPPIGELRFKAPQPVKSWTRVRQAKEFGPVCPQHDIMQPNIPNASEDCLYMNVYTPEVQPKTLYPVMFWIHGGGFIWGSGNDDMYGPEYLLRHGVIVVTFNYRLGTFGFLCLDTEDVPGNAGMKDQVAALRWVKRNIKSFGGDPDNITIFGESAGAGSVSYHLVSPMSKGLFKRAITQSGALTCWWCQAFAPRERAIRIAKQLGFYSDDVKELYEFFKKQPTESLAKVTSHLTFSAKSYEIPFGIADEKQFGNNERFFYGNVIDALKNNIHEGVEVITGFTSDEGLMALVVGDPIKTMMEKANFYQEFFTPKAIQTNCTIYDQLAAGREIRKFYFDNQVVSHDNVDKLIKFLGTDFFKYEIMLSAKYYSKRNKVFVYEFACNSVRNTIAHFFGFGDILKKPEVCHADDLAYLFNAKSLPKVDIESDAFQLIDRITRLWTNFAKCGDPTPDNALGVTWSPYTMKKENYLEIGNELKLGTSPEKQEIEFWDNIFKKYFPKYTCLE